MKVFWEYAAPWLEALLSFILAAAACALAFYIVFQGCHR
jgi:hypothetical protein